MLALLNWRVLVLGVVLATLAFSHFSTYRAGKNNVRNEWAAAVAASNAEARKMEQRRQDRANEAVQLAGKRDAALRADAARARANNDRLRDELDATRRYAAQSADAAAKSAAALADLFEQCSRRYSELAEIADRHANDALTLQQAWPK